MNRLTKSCNDVYECNINGSFCFYEGHCEDCKHLNLVVDKLGKYEDTGLEPEDVQKVADFMKLFPKLCEKYILNDKEKIG